MDLVLLAATASASIAAVVSTTWALRLQRRERARSAARVAALSAALDRPAASVPVATLFARETDRAVPRRAGVALAAAAAVASLLVVAVTTTRVDRGDRPAAVSTTAAPLELMSAEHSRTGRALTVSGLVRNPSGGAPRERVTATVVAFNDVGAIVGTGRAPLDLISLDPDQESPFLVTIADAETARRYRVSFSTGDGVLRHVDRRTAPHQIARTR